MARRRAGEDQAMSRGDQRRDRECVRHTGTCLIETTSGTQLVCPVTDCDYYERCAPRPAPRRWRKMVCVTGE